jgi:hypothetical protein
MLSNCFEVREIQESQAARPTQVLNLSPVRFEDVEIAVGGLPYGLEGKQLLKQLRREHNDTHVFRREGADRILAVPVSQDAPIIGKPETIRLKDHLELATALIRNALLNRLADLGGTSLDYDPIKVISGRDLLRSSCPAGIFPSDWLSVRLLFEVHIRPIFCCTGEPFIAALLNVRTTRLIQRSAAELLAEGFCMEGVYVRKRIPREDPRIAPKFDPLGCVASVNGSELRLTHCRTDVDAVEASEGWPSSNAFPSCLSHVFGERAPQIAAALECQRAVLRQGPAQIASITRLLEHLSSRQYEIVPGVTFNFGPFLDDSAPEFPNLIPSFRPTYVFDETGSKTHKWHDEGLKKYGPYTSHVQAMAPPKMCVICQRANRAQVDRFLTKFFFDGVTLPPPRDSVKSPQNYFEKGFCRKYALETVHREYFLADGNSADAYHDAFQQALETQANDHNWDLALVQIEEAFRNLPPERNPYFIAKLSFQSLQIPVQQFEIETTRKSGTALSFCLNYMGWRPMRNWAGFLGC